MFEKIKKFLTALLPSKVNFNMGDNPTVQLVLPETDSKKEFLVRFTMPEDCKVKDVKVSVLNAIDQMFHTAYPTITDLEVVTYYRTTK